MQKVKRSPMSSSQSPGLWIISVFLLMLPACTGTGPQEVPSPTATAIDISNVPDPPRAFRAAWIATVANIDWPSEPGLPVVEQKAELRAMLDQAAALGLNAVILQVRPAADALYDSPYEPWSFYLTGQQGQAPEPYYDPLAFAVREAHERGLGLHAWFNPFRAHHPSDTSAIAPGHVSREHPEWVVEYGDYLWTDPGVPEARTYTLKVILDVVKRYDIDGVHFDDYFYPYPSYADGADFPDDASWQRYLQSGGALSRADWRRRNVDRFIHELYRRIKEVKPWVKFGISPFGIWRPGHPEGTTGFDAYAQLYADARKWLREGWVDYLTPQLYYQLDQTGQPYSVMLRWWIEQNVKGRHLWPGNYTSGVPSGCPDESGEIIGQIYATRSHPGATGNVHFSMRTLMPAPDTTAQGRLIRRLKEGPYAQPALIPASPWLDDDPPARPAVKLRREDGPLTITMRPSGEEDVDWWVLRWRHDAGWTLDIVSGMQHSYVLEDSASPDVVAVSAVDRVGNEGPMTIVDVQNAVTAAGSS